MLFARKQANYGNEMTKLPAGFPAGSAAFWGSGLRLIAVLQADGAVEDRVLRRRVLAVRAEVAQAHELIGFRSLGRGERALDLAAREDLEGIRVQALKEVLVRRVGIGIGEEVRIQAYPASTASLASTQWMVDLTLRPSAGSPPREAGSYSQRTSVTLPSASLTQPVHLTT